MTAPAVLPWSSINQTAAALGPASDSLQPLARRVIKYGGGPAPSGLFGLSMGDYSDPIYQLMFDSTGKPYTYNSKGEKIPAFWTYVFPAAWSLAVGSGGNISPGSPMPDSSTFIAGTGHDNIFLLEDRATGRVWSVWMARQAGITAVNFTSPALAAASFQNIGAGVLWKYPQHTVGGASVGKPFLETSKVSVQRGMGIDKRALITTGEEIVDGVIRHPLELTIANTWYCDDLKTAVQGVDWLYPATRCEWDKIRYQNRNRDGVLLDLDKSKLVPEGLRVAFQVSIAERETWLDSKGFAKGSNWRRFWRIIIDALCDYGFVIAETGGFGMRVEMTGVLGPDRPIYESYGWDVTKLRAQEYTIQTFFNDFADRSYVVTPKP